MTAQREKLDREIKRTSRHKLEGKNKRSVSSLSSRLSITSAEGREKASQREERRGMAGEFTKQTGA